MNTFRINNGVFAFLSRQSLDIQGMKKVLDLYAESINNPKPTTKNKNAWYAEVSEAAQGEFKAFKKVFNKAEKNIPRRASYDDWWNECNLDGSFAYNGVTDDF
jgi:hypothetical protein